MKPENMQDQLNYQERSQSDLQLATKRIIKRNFVVRNYKNQTTINDEIIPKQKSKFLNKQE